MARLLPRFDKPRPAADGVMQRIYDAAATGWQDGIAKLGFLDAYAQLMQAAPGKPTPRVMDVGTGTGAFAAAWIAANGRPRALTLLDLSPVMLDTAAARVPTDRAIAASIGAPLEDVPLQDVILCAHVIEHLDDPATALAWLYARLAPGGLLVLALSKPHWCTALVRWRWGNAAFSPTQAREMLDQAGFAQIATHPFQSGPPSRVSCGYTALRH
ncbi:class I SAM-dependent methyltransferase [uncultured Tateyamaria sp.]|uniref:class I SAM-dependent methyltransferase n=1 Tax=Tateyamaria sp. 1078 TaxID=3417464 RepID=UPI0026248903|nr:class I SAM-dependent methyltransferase [uncultured Tateyamaria sp.]